MKRLSVLTVAICVLWAGAAAAQTSRILVSNAGQAAPTEEEPELIGDLENPGAASFQSGLGLISGWVCEAEAVEIELNVRTTGSRRMGRSDWIPSRRVGIRTTALGCWSTGIGWRTGSMRS